MTSRRGCTVSGGSVGVDFGTLAGNVPHMEKEVSEADADAKIGKFLAEFSEEQITWNQITR